MEILLVLVVVAVLALVWVVVLYNRMVSARQTYRNAFAQIDVQLNRRHDLIPNLVEAVKGYMAHERQTLTAVISARNAAITAQQTAAANPGDPGAMVALAGAENLLTQSLGQMFALSEGYPELKANQNMLHLSEELTSTENRIAFARQHFNDAVASYNIRREQFPANLVAGTFSFAPAALLQLQSPEHGEVPRLEL